MFGWSKNDRSHNNTWSKGQRHGGRENPNRSMYGHARNIRNDKPIRVLRPERRNDRGNNRHRGGWF